MTCRLLLSRLYEKIRRYKTNQKYFIEPNFIQVQKTIKDYKKLNYIYFVTRKENIEITKANKVATKKIEIIANQIAAITSITLPLSSSPSFVNMPKNTQKLAQNSYISPSSANKINPHLILNLMQCIIDFNKQLLKNIREYLLSSLKASN